MPSSGHKPGALVVRGSNPRGPTSLFLNDEIKRAEIFTAYFLILVRKNWMLF